MAANSKLANSKLAKTKLVNCCRCNQRGRCKNCICSKKGLQCKSCLPSRLGNCLNLSSASISNSQPSTSTSVHTSSPESVASSQPFEQVSQQSNVSQLPIDSNLYSGAPFLLLISPLFNTSLKVLGMLGLFWWIMFSHPLTRIF